MKTNLGSTDRMARIVIAIVLAALAYFEIGGATLSIVFLIISVVMLVTALVRFCPLYRIFGINSCKITKK